MICARRRPEVNVKRLSPKIVSQFNKTPNTSLFKNIFTQLNEYVITKQYTYVIDTRMFTMTPLDYSLRKICGRRDVCFASFVVAYLDALGLLGMKCIQHLTISGKKHENIVLDFIRRLFDAKYYQQTQLDRMISLSKSSPVKITRQQVQKALRDFEERGFQQTVELPPRWNKWFSTTQTRIVSRQVNARQEIIRKMMKSLEARGYRASVGKLYFFNVSDQDKDDRICFPQASELVFKYITESTRNTFERQKEFLEGEFETTSQEIFYIKDVEKELNLKREGHTQQQASIFFRQDIQISLEETLFLRVPVVCSANENGILMHKAPGETISSLERSSHNNHKVILICIQLLIMYLQKNHESEKLMIIHNDLHEGNMMLYEQTSVDANRTKIVEYHVSIIDFGDAECLERDSPEDQRLFATMKKILKELLENGLTSELEECLAKTVSDYYDWRLNKMASGVQRVIRNIVSKFGSGKMESFHSALDTVAQMLGDLQRSFMSKATFAAIISTINNFFEPIPIGSLLQGYTSSTKVHSDDGKNWIIILVLVGICRSPKIQRIFTIFDMKLDPVQILDVLSSVYRGYNDMMSRLSSATGSTTSSTHDLRALFNAEFIREHASNPIVFTFLWKLLFDKQVRKKLLAFLRTTNVSLGLGSVSLYDLMTTNAVLEHYPEYLNMTRSFIAFLQGPPPDPPPKTKPPTNNPSIKQALVALL